MFRAISSQKVSNRKGAIVGPAAHLAAGAHLAVRAPRGDGFQRGARRAASCVVVLAGAPPKRLTVPPFADASEVTRSA